MSAHRLSRCRGRRALTESEEEDRAAEEGLEGNGEAEEEEPVLSYDEFLAAKRKPVALPKLPEARKAGEGVAIKLEQRSAAVDLEVRRVTVTVFASQRLRAVSVPSARHALCYTYIESRRQAGEFPAQCLTHKNH